MNGVHREESAKWSAIKLFGVFGGPVFASDILLSCGKVQPISNHVWKGRTALVDELVLGTA